MTPPSNRPRLGVAAVTRTPDGRVLLVERRKAPGQGTWAFPGGHVEWGESLSEALVREVAEECRLTVTPGTLLAITEIVDPAYHPAAYHLVVLDYACAAKDLAAEARSDAGQVGWFTADEVERLPLAPGMSLCLARPNVRRFLQWDGEPDRADPREGGLGESCQL